MAYYNIKKQLKLFSLESRMPRSKITIPVHNIIICVVCLKFNVFNILNKIHLMYCTPILLLIF